MKKKVRCIRCEALDRKQKYIATLTKNALGDLIPLCTLCIAEIGEEEEIFMRNSFEEDEGEYRDEIFN